jgi:ADP-heptose:LPS heptosyltransferase
MIFTTHVFHALKEAYPPCELSVIGSPKNKETLAYNPDIDRYIVCPDSLWGLWKEIRSCNAEYAFSFVTSSFDLALLYLANVPAIAVFSVQNAIGQTRSYNFLKSFCVQIPFYSGEHFALQNLKLLAPLGINSTNTKKYLYFSHEAGNRMREFIRSSGINMNADLVFALAPGAGTKIKQWPAERFAKLADHLSKKYKTPIFVVGGSSDKNEFEEMSGAVSGSTALISCLDQSIDEFKAFVAHVDVMIANDSAPIYMAEAFDRATVTIVGPTNENEHPPKGPHHRVVKRIGKEAPVLASMVWRTFDPNEARRQIESISVERVITTVDELAEKVQKRVS